MTGCSEYRPRLIELARGLVAAEERAALAEHLAVCAGCARALDEQLALTAALDALAGEALPEMAEMEARVLAEFDGAASRRRRARWIPVVGLAAAALIGVFRMEHRTPVSRPRVRVMAEAAPRPVTPVVQVRHKVTPRRASEESEPFLPIPYTVPLAPEERTAIVRMEIPVAALIAAGFDVPVVDPGAVVEADVLVSQDGRARAIRPVSK